MNFVLDLQAVDAPQEGNAPGDWLSFVSYFACSLNNVAVR